MFLAPIVSQACLGDAQFSRTGVLWYMLASGGPMRVTITRVLNYRD